jgi:hypothetical protein
MAHIFYAAVEDDPLTSGPGSRVFASERTSTVQGEDGKRRRLAYIGDKAYCPTCQSEGVIIGGAGVRQERRLIDSEHGGRRQAVGGDEVLCQCPVHPRIVAVHGRRWKIHDQGEAETTSSSIASAPVIHHWIAFSLRESGDCQGLKCVAYFEDGSKAYGTFDASNTVRFERARNGSECVRVDLSQNHGMSASGSVSESLLSAITG